MRIAFFVSEFPKISETFILDQIVWLLDHGCEIDIYAQYLSDQRNAHPEVAAYSLMDHAFQLSPPPTSSKPARVARALREVIFAFARDPGTVALALNPIRFGIHVLKFKPFYRAAPVIRRAPYDVIHCHFGPNGAVAAELRDLGALRAPLLTQFHGFDISSYVRAHGECVYSGLFATGDLFLCVSERIRERLVRLGCDRHKTLVHRTGVQVRDIPFTHRNPGASAGPRILTVARLVEKKGVAFGLRAMAQLHRDYPDMRYMIIGDGPQLPALAALARELGIDDHVTFAGAKPRNAVAKFMRDSDILLAPSITARDGDEEGIPVAIMEALASGLAVVSTHHAGIPELVSHGVSGLLAPECDPEALARHVKHLLTHPNERRSMAVAGRHAVEQRYDIAEQNSKLFALYREMAQSFRNDAGRNSFTRRWIR